MVEIVYFRLTDHVNRLDTAVACKCLGTCLLELAWECMVAASMRAESFGSCCHQS
jgi:hypothetical protein